MRTALPGRFSMEEAPAGGELEDGNLLLRADWRKLPLDAVLGWGSMGTWTGGARGIEGWLLL